MPDDAIGYVLTQYYGRGLPPERSVFEDKVKAEKAFTEAKVASILWQSRPVTSGLGWIKLKEKEAPPPSAAVPVVKPAVPAVVAAAKPAAPAPAAVLKPESPKPQPVATPAATTPEQK